MKTLNNALKCALFNFSLLSTNVLIPLGCFKSALYSGSQICFTRKQKENHSDLILHFSKLYFHGQHLFPDFWIASVWERLSQTSHCSNSAGKNCKSLTALYELSGARNRLGCDYTWEVRVEHHFLSRVFSCLVIKRNGKSNVSSFNLLFHYFVVSVVICLGLKITVIARNSVVRTENQYYTEKL